MFAIPPKAEVNSEHCRLRIVGVVFVKVMRAIIRRDSRYRVTQLDRARRRAIRKMSRSSARPWIKKKAGGRYAADLVLQLPPRGAGSAALRSACYFYLDRYHPAPADAIAPGYGQTIPR